MSEYSFRGTCSIPVGMVQIANVIWRALDPDIGGGVSFDFLRAVDQDGNEFAVTSALCTPDFAGQSEFLMANPEALFGVVSSDYAVRWGGMPPPTLEEVTSFCSGGRIVVTLADQDYESHLNTLGLTPKVQE